MWARINPSNEVSPLDILKKFRDSLKKETDGEFTASIDVNFHETRSGYPLAQYRFNVKHRDYSVSFLDIKQKFSSSNELTYYPP